MTEVLQSPTHTHFPSPQSSSPNNDPHQHSLISSVTDGGSLQETEEERERARREREREQLSLLAFLVGAFRKSLIGCSNVQNKELCSMEIGWPSNVRHVAHVTFDRFNGFLGLPVEFEPEVPRRAPSASANVFGVSTQSMQLSFDSRGNSVPTILLLMQRHLYARGGLQAEGIFRINAENSQEEYVREQLNMGLVPDNVDVHCLAGLIKAWFRELPAGVLDSLSPEQVMQSQSEEECVELVRLLPPTEAALLDWAINLMADVAQLEHMNKMNARNVAMVFAPNMTQMADPLTALMYAVQVMNFLKTLIIKTLREREDSVLDTAPTLRLDPTDENGHNASAEPMIEDCCENSEAKEVFVAEECVPHSSEDDSKTENRSQSFRTNVEKLVHGGNRILADNCPCEVVSQVSFISGGHKQAKIPLCKSRSGQTSNCHLKKNSKKISERPMIHAAVPLEKGKGTVIVSRINSRKELVEVWR